MPRFHQSLTSLITNNDMEEDLEGKIKALELQFKEYFTRLPTARPQTPTIGLDALLNKLKNFVENSNVTPKDDLRMDILVYLVRQYGLMEDGEGGYVLSEKALKLLEMPGIEDFNYIKDRQLSYRINQAIDEKKKADELKRQQEYYRNWIRSSLPKAQPSYVLDAKHQEERAAALQILQASVDSHPKQKRALQTLTDTLVLQLGEQEKEIIRLKEEKATTALGNFLYDVDYPGEDDRMVKSLKDLLVGFESEEKGVAFELELLIKIHAEFFHHESKHENLWVNKWYFLNTVYAKIKNEGETALQRAYYELEKHQKKEGVSSLIRDLKLVDETHQKMTSKTNWQAFWMMFGGFAFGIECVMLVLENMALMSPLGPWAVLGISIGACIPFGIPIALYFHSAHYDELLKHNRFEYFHQHRLKAPEPSNAWGKRVAGVGTVQEGLAAGVLLVTLGAFLIDMVTWGMKGGEYTSALPGLFTFGQVSASANPFIIGLAVVSALALVYTCYKVASALASAHYALDGKHTVEYYDKLKEEEAMRGTVTATSKPLTYGKWTATARKARHKFDTVFTSHDTELRSVASMPI